MREHFPAVSRAERARVVDREFRERKETKPALAEHPSRHAHLVMTQNVRGMASKRAARQWMTWFKRKQRDRVPDVVFLQETHANMRDADRHARTHAAQWGWRVAETVRPLSFWTVSERRAAGVGILVNPYGAAREVKEWRADLWTPYVMAVTCEIGSQRWVMVNVYAPTTTTDRERYYASIAALPFPAGHAIMMAGDFNCTLDEADRTTPNATHGSAALRQLMGEHQLVDTFHVQPARSAGYTYWYQHGSGMAGSRLDRVLISASHSSWICHTATVPVTGFSDHDGVTCAFQCPTARVRSRPGKALYPLLYPALEPVMQYFRTVLESETWAPTMDSHEATIQRWNVLKIEWAAGARAVKRDSQRQVRRQYRRRATRIRNSIDTQRSQHTGGDTDRLRRDLHALSSLLHEWHDRTADFLQAKVRYKASYSSKVFYKRIQTKFEDTLLAPMRTPRGHVTGVEQADAIADAWAPILHPQRANSAHGARMQGVLGPTLSAESRQTMDIPIKQNEVRQALRHCNRAKAAGPDSLPNDWYRDHEEVLVVLLTRLFVSCQAAAAVPASFGESTIFLLRKAGDPNDPLNFRPLSLLNSDYKIYTRIWASRLSRVLSECVHPNQAGFVPGRSIHATIDLLHAARAAAASQAPDSVVVMLDIRKAYDTLSRAFMLAILARAGFSAHFCAIVASMHDQTWTRFRVNGFLSRRQAVTSGVRQGCPLAPLLFILAMQPLYDLVEASSTLEGVAMGASELRIAGYADDTAVYLQNYTAIPALLQVLDRFGDASGLVVNRAKSTVLGLARVIEECGQLTQVEATATVRYLGIQVGHGDEVAANWDRVAQGLRVRLRLACEKTLTVEDRCRIAGAMIVPRVLYTARHCWPTPGIVAQLEASTKSFIWRGFYDASSTRGWVDQHTILMSEKNGGFAAPHIRMELVALAARTVRTHCLARQACTSQWAINVLVADAQVALPVQPTCGAGGVTPRDSIWRTGVEAFAYVNRVNLCAEYRTEVHAFSANGAFATAWVKGMLRFQYTGSEQRLVNYLDFIHRTFGRTDVRWLPQLMLQNGAPMLTPDGIAVNKTLMPTFWKRPISECCTFTRADRHVVLFRPAERWKYPFSNSVAAQFHMLCAAIITTYPHVMYVPPPPAQLLPIDRGLDECHFWTVEETHMQYIAWPNAPTTCSLASDVARPAALLAGLPHPVAFQAHWNEHAVVQIWPGRHVSNKRIRTELYARLLARGSIRTTKAALQWATDDTDVGHAVAAFHAAPYQTSWASRDRVALRRLAWRAFSPWHIADNNADSAMERCCVVPECTMLHVTHAHLFWSCRSAQQAWDAFFALWRVSPGTPATTFCAHPPIPACLANAMAADAPAPRPITLRHHQQRLDALTTTMGTAWTTSVMAVVRTIWWRWCQLAHDDEPTASDCEWSTTVMVAMSAAWRHLHAAAPPANRDLYRHLMRRSRDDVAPLAPTPCEWVLFFDGGSRGNPGSGGAGSVLVRVQPAGAFTVRAIVYTWLPDAQTTNNVAEYAGLLAGLELAQEHAGAEAIQVVGDSRVVLAHMRTRRVGPRSVLRQHHAVAARVAAQLHITQWVHHFRAFNTAADVAANHAMDARQSRRWQAGERETDAECAVRVRVDADYAEWRRHVHDAQLPL